MMKKTILIMIMIGCVFMTACNGNGNPGENNANTNSLSGGNPVVQMEVENFGTMTIELYPEYAPNTVNNFIDLVEKGLYDGLEFHRIIAGFMIQGGNAQGTPKASLTTPIKGEFASNGFAQNTLKHTEGVISMARTGDPNSATSQFFIMHDAAPHLDGAYAGFGMVTEGLDVIDKIATTPLAGEVPIDPVVIKSVKVISK